MNDAIYWLAASRRLTAYNADPVPATVAPKGRSLLSVSPDSAGMVVPLPLDALHSFAAWYAGLGVPLLLSCVEHQCCLVRVSCCFTMHHLQQVGVKLGFSMALC